MSDPKTVTIEGFRTLVREPSGVTADDRAQIAAIFDAAYAQANQAYLDASIEHIGRIAFALTGRGRARGVRRGAPALDGSAGL